LEWVMLGQVYNLVLELPQYQQNITQKIDSLHLHSAGRSSNAVAMLSEESRQSRGGVAPAIGSTLPDAPRPHIRRRSRTASEPSKDHFPRRPTSPSRCA
jgi:hypothetical protein